MENNLIQKNTFFNIIKVAISNIIKLASGVLIGFLLPKIIGVTDYGYYKTFTLYASYIGMFSIGITDGIYLKYGGKSYNELKKEDFRYISLTYIIIQFLFSIAILIISLIFFNNEIQFIFICLSFTLMFSNITGYFQIISQITSRFKELAFRNIIQSFLITISIVILWLIHKFLSVEISYKIYTIIYVFIICLLCFWYIFSYRDIIFGKINISLNISSVLFTLIKSGIPLMISNLCSSLILTIDRQFVNILFDTNTYATYAFAYNMLGLITTALSAISTVIYPSLRKTDFNLLKQNYHNFISIILIMVFACVIIYFPLVKFVLWFLPKYADSLIIFRIILPGLAISSAITIIMHNFYKTANKNFLFFLISVSILIISCIANFLAYYFFKSTESISIASIVVMIIWYLSVELFFIVKYKVKWKKNFIYMLFMLICFYAISMIDIWWIGMIAYLISYIIVTFSFYFSFFKKNLKKIK